LASRCSPNVASNFTIKVFRTKTVLSNRVNLNTEIDLVKRTLGMKEQCEDCDVMVSLSILRVCFRQSAQDFQTKHSVQHFRLPRHTGGKAAVRCACFFCGFVKTFKYWSDGSKSVARFYGLEGQNTLLAGPDFCFFTGLVGSSQLGS